MEHYDDSFDNSDALPTVKEIEQRLRMLGCTKEQISRHLDQVTKSRTQPAEQKPPSIATINWTGPSRTRLTAFPRTTG